MTTTKRATMAALKDIDDRERPQEFKPCSTCRYKFLFAGDGRSGEACATDGSE